MHFEEKVRVESQEGMFFQENKCEQNKIGLAKIIGYYRFYRFCYMKNKKSISKCGMLKIFIQHVKC